MLREVSSGVPYKYTPSVKEIPLIQDGIKVGYLIQYRPIGALELTTERFLFSEKQFPTGEYLVGVRTIYD